MFDLVVGASSIYAGTWMEASGAVYAENQALRVAGRPGRASRRRPRAASCRAARSATCPRSSPPGTRIVPRTAPARRTAARGLHRRDALVGRHGGGGDGRRPARRPAGRPRPDDGRGAGGGDRSGGRRTGSSRSSRPPARRTSARSTTWPASPGVCREHGLWMHVDGAYGGAALAAPSVRDRFAGIEHADSFIVDPHKWLFAPFDSCALLYRRPELARAAHTPARRLPRRRPGQRAGTRPTTRSTSAGGRAACRSGSRSPRTARAPTPRRSSTRSTVARAGRRRDPRAGRTSSS